MKKLTIVFIIIFISLRNLSNIHAEQRVFLDDTNYLMISEHSDQDEEVVVSKFYDYKKNIVAFCIEPKQKFNNSKSYYQTLNDDKYLANIAKAYYALGSKDDNYYIAAQILIWQYLTNVKYTFNGNSYDEYINAILNYINEPIIEKYENCIYINDEICIDVDLEKYDYELDGLQLISDKENKLVCKLFDNTKEYAYINLIPKDIESAYTFIYNSNSSQDLFSFEGEYNFNNKIIYEIRNNNFGYFDLYYSKKDIKNNNIKNAVFTLYKIDELSEDEISFMHINTDINLIKELLGIENENYKIEISERYEQYLNGNVINTNEVGYFDYKIIENNSIVKQGRIYVSDDNTQTNNKINTINVEKYKTSLSEDIDINTIKNIENGFDYYLCESEPAKGYTYTQNACTLIKASDIHDKVYKFINDERTYTLRLMKQNPNDILLDGASFKVTYKEDNIVHDLYYTTGALQINRTNSYKYLIYKHEEEDEINIYEFVDDKFTINNAKPGKYYYYQSDINEIDLSKLQNDFVKVVDGGFVIDDLPYSSKLIIEELAAPNGYMIIDPIYEIYPNISYSEITFKNYRVNFFDIRAKDKFIIPKTCVGD